MSRPDERPFRRLPTLEERRTELERCVFCPKLCRTACPVSNAEPRETLTPWGKMSMAYFVANESVEAAAEFAGPAWACTGCFGCRSLCDHDNDVAETLFAARSALAREGLAPAAAERVLGSFGAHAERFANETRALASTLGERADHASGDVSGKAGTTSTALLVGCAYAQSDEGAAAVRAASALTGGPVTLVDRCCGAPLLHAGDQARFARQGQALAAAVRGASRLVVVDAGCASTIRLYHQRAGLELPRVELLVELAARELGKLRPNPEFGQGGPVRYHDACQLGRGLGIYDAPRAVLARVLGRAPDEFPNCRASAHCSGAGGLLPVTMPQASGAIAKARVAEHADAGGGTIVTTCASSLRTFRKQGAHAVDLVTVIARALADGAR